MFKRGWVVWLSGLLVVLLSGCSGPSVDGEREHVRRAQAKRMRMGTPTAAKMPDAQAAKVVKAEPVTRAASEVVVPELPPGPEELILGVYRLKDKGVIDGDTVKVEGLDSSLRLLAIDTEETFKRKKDDRAAAQTNFARYAADKRGDSKYPAKYATPMGEEAARWAKAWFVGIDEVRLEYDDLGRTRGVFGRHLVYVFAFKNGHWQNYNLACVRAGMSPYFPKYGYSRRFHDAFVEAQAAAREEGLGVWGGVEVGAYPDYDERLAWWERRAQAIRRFEENHFGAEDVFQLGLESEWTRMGGKLGESVTVFGSISRMKMDKSPYLAILSHAKGKDFTVVAFERDVLAGLGLEALRGEYFYIRGKLSTYKGKYQFKAAAVEKVWTE